MGPPIAALCLFAATITLQATAQEPGGMKNTPAQDPHQRWTELELSRGSTVTVEDSSGSRMVGTLLGLEGESLLLRVSTKEQRIDRDLIRRVTSGRRDSLKNGILTGVLVGAGMAAVSSCRINDRKCGVGGRAAFLGFGAGLWGAIGAEIDRSVDRRRTLYEAPPK
jgi:hypothetical protein